MNKEKYDKLFSEQRIWNSEIITFSKLTVKEGRLAVSDALVCFDMSVRPYTESVPVGEYDVKACIADFDGSKRIAAVTVPFTDKPPASFAMALDGTEDPEEVANLKEDEFFGFGVDAGLAAIADTAALKAYSEFVDKWENEHDGDNIYDGYLSDLFKKSYEAAPDHQRPDGDFIDLTVPGTDMHIPMFASGWGDGYYPVYWGYSEDGSLCSVTILFIDPDVEDEDF